VSARLTDTLIFNKHCATLEEAVTRIITLANANSPHAVSLSVSEADAYLVSFKDPSGKAGHRMNMAEALRNKGPKTPLMDEIVDAVFKGKTPAE
jgi:hypothetical protein